MGRAQVALQGFSHSVQCHIVSTMIRRGLSFGRSTYKAARRRQEGSETEDDAPDTTAGAIIDVASTIVTGTSTSTCSNRKADRAIVATASDAITSKLHAVSAGYYDDPFIAHFAHGAEGLTAAAATGTAALPVYLEGQQAADAVATSSTRMQRRHRTQPNPHHHAVVARANSSPPDSSSSTASNFNEDEWQQNNPLASMSPSDVHPALRGRLGLAGGGNRSPVSGPSSSIRPGVRRHISAGPGGTEMMMPPPMQHSPHHNPQRAHGQGGQPLIRRGTHARVCAMDRALTAFLSARSLGGDVDDVGEHQQQGNKTKESDTCVKQVVVMGAGRDTSYLRYIDNKLIDGSNALGHHYHQETRRERVRWYEVDHPGVMHKKMALLKTSPRVIVDEMQKDATGNVSYAVDVRLRNEGIASSTIATKDQSDADKLESSLSNKRDGAILPYHLIGFDLRLSPLQLFETLQSALHGFDPSVPTLFLFECVLMYLPESSAISLLRGVSSICGPNAIVAIYDPVLGNDGFGRVMEQHLTRAGVAVPPTMDSNDQLCLTACRTIDSHLDHLTACGFQIAIGCDMLAAYDTVIGMAQRARANAVEMLDEIEEWMLIMRHYCLVVAGITTGSEIDLASHLCSAGDHSPLGFLSTKSVMRGTNKQARTR